MLMSQLLEELERLGVREFEITLFSDDPERGWSALQNALTAHADNPIRYAIKLLEDPAFKPQRPRHATNLVVDVNCPRCGGDRFVLAGTRPPAQSAWMRERGIEPNKTQVIEEMRPCPQCGLKA
jgi:hypothetical protein